MGVNIQHSRFEVVKGFMDSFTDVEVVQPLVAPKDRLVDAMQVEGEVVLGLYPKEDGL